MSLLQRVDALLGGLLACVLGCLVAWNSPFLKFDAGVLLFGAALAWPLFWWGSWSWSRLIGLAAIAYFFRCVVLYLMGTDAVRSIAFRDTGMGLVAVGSVYAVRQAIRKYAAQDATITCQELVRDGVAPSDSRFVGQVFQKKANETAETGEGGKTIWSPPQITLKMWFLLTLAWIGLVVVGVTGGLRAAFGVLLLGLFWFLIVGCIRLVLSAGRER